MLEGHGGEVDADRVRPEWVRLEVPARGRGDKLVPEGRRIGVPVGHVEVERLAAAVGVVDRDRPGRGAVLARAEEPEIGSGPGHVDGLAGGDDVVRGAGWDRRPGKGSAV